MLLRTLVFALAMTLVSVAAPASQTAPVGDELASELDAVVLRSQLGQFWGAVLVAQDGKPILSKGYGLANQSLMPIDRRTLFDIGSIAKQFTAALALKLHVQGRLSLDEPITRYFADLPARAKSITLRHLLTHTSGLSDMNGAIQSLDFADRDEAVRLAFKSRAKSAPGERFEYCNGGYCIAAAIIERAAGGPFQALMREEIFKPAGLTNTGFLDGDGLDLSNASARVVSGRGGEVRHTILQDGWGWGLRGCGGVLMSLEDILKWDQTLRSDTLFDEATRRAMYSPALDGYALGWFVEPSAAGGNKVWHTGGTRGYRAYLVRIPEQAIVVAVLTNERNDPIGLGNRLLEELVPQERKGIRATLNITGLTLNAYKSAVIDDDVQIDVRRVSTEPGKPVTGSELTLSAAVANERLKVVKIWMPAIQAKTTSAAIRNHLKTKRTDVSIPSGISLTIGTLPYTPTEGLIDLPPDAVVTVMPRYTGMDEDGNRVIDERICLVVMDSQGGFWPVILKLDRAAADHLADRLDREPPLDPSADEQSPISGP